MAKYFDIIMYTGLMGFFILADLVLYYGYGHHHSLIPFYISLVLTITVTGIAGMALYETFKHRNDKEPW